MHMIHVYLHMYMYRCTCKLQLSVCCTVWQLWEKNCQSVSPLASSTIASGKSIGFVFECKWIQLRILTTDSSQWKHILLMAVSLQSSSISLYPWLMQWSQQLSITVIRIVVPFPLSKNYDTSWLRMAWCVDEILPHVSLTVGPCSQDECSWYKTGLGFDTSLPNPQSCPLCVVHTYVCC